MRAPGGAQTNRRRTVKVSPIHSWVSSNGRSWSTRSNAPVAAPRRAAVPERQAWPIPGQCDGWA
eukprot:3566217-Lingulodinium_polyedra.AAC.1